jgi:glycosyltransferase involved in cell wall biosynthesis
LKQISILHPYLEERRSQISEGLYPKQHLWGVESLEKQKSINSNLIQSKNSNVPKVLEKVLNRFLFQRSTSLELEVAALRASHKCDLLYSVCGPLGLARFHNKNSRLVSWVFRKPEKPPKSKLHPYHIKNLGRHAGFFCLTPKAEKYFSQFAPSKFIPWGVDLEMFDGKGPRQKADSPFFLASGKTGRDYQTLIEGAGSVNAELRVIGPISQRPPSLPSNVKWLDTTVDPPDQAIDYPTLREWYAQCVGVCIPLSGDADDTCGYTNMLEAMAMAKPVLMTLSGCLHLNPADHDFGCSIESGNPKEWANSMRDILENKDRATTLGKNGRKIAEEELSIGKFDRKVVTFLHEILGK